MNTPGALVMTVVNPIKDVRKVDSHTVDIETKQPFPILLSILTHFFVMDKDWLEKNDAMASTDLQQKKENFANRHGNGTGPFKLKSREVDVKTVLEVNPSWWDKPQHNLTEVVFTPSSPTPRGPPRSSRGPSTAPSRSRCRTSSGSRATPSSR